MPNYTLEVGLSTVTRLIMLGGQKVALLNTAQSTQYSTRPDLDLHTLVLASCVVHRGRFFERNDTTYRTIVPLPADRL